MATQAQQLAGDVQGEAQGAFNEFAGPVVGIASGIVAEANSAKDAIMSGLGPVVSAITSAGNIAGWTAMFANQFINKGTASNLTAMSSMLKSADLDLNSAIKKAPTILNGNISVPGLKPGVGIPAGFGGTAAAANVSSGQAKNALGQLSKATKGLSNSLSKISQRKSPC